MISYKKQKKKRFHQRFFLFLHKKKFLRSSKNIITEENKLRKVDFLSLCILWRWRRRGKLSPKKKIGRGRYEMPTKWFARLLIETEKSADSASWFALINYKRAKRTGQPVMAAANLVERRKKKKRMKWIINT